MTGFRITLEAARVNAGLTQKIAAERLGVNVSTLAAWEKNPLSMGVGDMRNACELYACPEDLIFLPCKSD